ncbi:MAG TPA: ATP-binding protein [Ignavibacteriaceae bacterium]|nr:ATP-binding protein [Ignavibacteriaceae bacterium]
MDIIDNSNTELLDEIKRLKLKIEKLNQSADLHKLTEKKFREKEKSYRDIVNSVSDAIFIQDSSGKFLDINEGALNMYGYERKDFINQTPEFISAPGKNKIELINYYIAKALNGEVQRFQWWGIRKNGEVFPKDVVLNRGQFLGQNVAIAIARDITERIESETIQNSLYSIAEITNTTDDINDFYKSMHNIIKEMMYADNFYIALIDETTGNLTFPYFIDEVDSPPEPKRPGKGLSEYVLKNGESLLAPPKVVKKLISSKEIDDIGAPSIDWLGVPLKTLDKTIGVLVIQSYTEKIRYTEKDKELLAFVSQHVATAIERKKSNDSIKKYSKELEILNKNKDRFLSIISHDLRSPFHPLLGLAKILATESDTLTKEEIKNYTNEIFELLKGQYTLLEDLLEWARLQSNSIRFQQKKINLYETIFEVTNILSENAIKKKISFNNLVNKDIFVFADRNFLRSIIQNLVSNAIKFSFENMEIMLEAKVNKNIDFVTITVADNGIGMTDQARDNIFSKKAEHSKPGTQDEKGSGLGLILCKEMVAKHGGNIWVESKLNKGSKFIFTLPNVK